MAAGVGAPGDRDLAQYAGPPTTTSPVTYPYYNSHGDLAAEANQSGTRTAAYTYDPFGAIRSGVAPPNTLSERWAASWNKKLDSTSSVIEMGVRPYDPSLGRFLSPDPVAGGSCNLYDYACQEPLNNYDLDGKACGFRIPFTRKVIDPCRTVVSTLTFWRNATLMTIQHWSAYSDRLREWMNENLDKIKKLLSKASDCDTIRGAAAILSEEVIRRGGATPASLFVIVGIWAAATQACEQIAIHSPYFA